jgi:hypothetical protein
MRHKNFLRFLNCYQTRLSMSTKNREKISAARAAMGNRTALPVKPAAPVP